MLTPSSPHSQRGQWTLIGTLVALTIIIILAGLYIPRIAAKHSKPGEKATPRERALGAGCGAYLGQMNQAVSMYKMDNDDKPPRALDALKRYGVTNDMIYAEGCSFAIDPTTGAVTESGKGRAMPGVYYAPPGRPSAAPPPSNALPPGPRGPGGVRLPPIPGAGASSLPGGD